MSPVRTANLKPLDDRSKTQIIRHTYILNGIKHMGFEGNHYLNGISD